MSNDFFALSENLEPELKDPLIAWSYLDVIGEALDRNEIEPQKEEALQAALLLPESTGKAAHFRTLHAGAPLPSDVPGLSFPPLLHKDIASHPIFRRKKVVSAPVHHVPVSPRRIPCRAPMKKHAACFGIGFNPTNAALAPMSG